MGSTREWEAILGSGDGELGGIVGGSVGLHVGVVMGSGRDCGRRCGAICGCGDGEWEGVHGVLDGRGYIVRAVGRLRGGRGPWWEWQWDESW
jgi:hypothetical protein